MAALTNPAFGPALDDMRVQLDDLVYPGWVTATGRRRLPDVLRYLRAMVQRLDKLPGDVARDAERMQSVADVTRAWDRLLDLPPATRPPAADLARIRWMLEELRVSYWAQTLGTPHPVSEKRVRRAIDQLGG
jgi:ATP-dependent helicase HrpA